MDSHWRFTLPLVSTTCPLLRKQYQGLQNIINGKNSAIVWGHKANTQTLMGLLELWDQELHISFIKVLEDLKDKIDNMQKQIVNLSEGMVT